jgi:PAS domain S-box-containing protein
VNSDSGYGGLLAHFASTLAASKVARVAKQIVTNPIYVALFGLAALTLLGGLMYFTYTEFESHNRVAKQNTIVMVGQLEPNALRFENALHAAEHAPDNPDTSEDILLFGEILLSRFSVIETHLIKEDLLEDDGLRQRWLAVFAYQPLVEKIVEASPAERQEMLTDETLATIEEFTRDARIFSVRGMQVAIHRSTNARLHLSEMVTSFATASFILIACLSVLTFTLALSWKRNIHISAKENAARDSLQKIYDFSSEGILVIDRNNRFVMANPEARRLLRMQDEDLENTSLAPAFFKRNNHFTSSQEFIEKAIFEKVDRPIGARGAFLEQSGRALLRDGSSIDIELRMTEDRDISGNPVVIMFLRDVSTHVEREQELRDARDEAVQAVQSRLRFFAAMSHEMRTPISGAIAAVDAIETRTKINNDQKRLLRIAAQSANAALDQINNVLDLAWLERGEIQTEVAQFNLVDVIEDLVDRFRPLAANNDTDIELDLPERYEAHLSGPLRVFMRPLNNLLSNAMKHTTDGVIVVRAGILGDQVRIEVEDTGTGVDEGTGDRIFEPFEMGGDKGPLQENGTGLGLAIAKRAVESMNGEIGYTSRAGYGSLFWFTARFDRSLPQLGSAQAPNHCDADSNAPISHEVLIVEDNEASRLLAKELLEFYGHKVAEAPNGLEGANMATSTCYDVILMDVNMPIMGGIEATKRIREYGASKETRIVGVTAFGAPDDIQQFKESGMDMVLPKPLTSKDINRIFGVSSIKGNKTIRSVASIETIIAATKSLREDVTKLSKDLSKSTADDCTQLRDDAHRAKGLAAMIEIKDLSETLGKLEKLLTDNDIRAAQRYSTTLSELVEEKL